MKTCLLTLIFCALTAASPAFGQNTMKLFDPTPITPTDTSYAWNARNPMTFAAKDVYLSCPIGGPNFTYLSGPNNGALIADNFFMMNGTDICPDEWNCFASSFVSPLQMIGQPVESAYIGVAPIDVSSQVTSSGVYSFALTDYSYAYGNSEIDLHTSCTFGSYVCHKNNGSSGSKTLAVSDNMFAAHMAHGDKAGPCN